MTLVAGFSMGGPPSFVGDLLTSWQVPTEVLLPTTQAPEIHKTLDGYYASGLAQKLVIVRPYLLIVWAGSVSEAKKLITSLDDVLPSEYCELERNLDSLFSILNELPPSIEVVAVLLDEEWIRPFCVHTRGFSIENKRFYLLGTGNEVAFNFLTEMTAGMPEPDNSEGLAGTAVLINFAGNALMAQYATKVGLPNAWGGGFEVANVTKQGFRKVDNILVRCWSLDFEWKLGNIGVSFLMHYEGPTLKLSSFGNSDRTTIVKSWLKYDSQTHQHAKRIAEWTVDLFYAEPIGRPVCAVQKEYPWSKSASRFFFSDNVLKSWSMDQSRVNKIVERIKLSGASNLPFSVGPF